MWVSGSTWHRVAMRCEIAESAGVAALAAVAASAEQVLVTAAVGDDIPSDWDARRIGITMRDEDGGRISAVEV